MNSFTYEYILNSIPQSLYRNYRIRIDRTDFFVPLDKFMDDMQKLSLNAETKYHCIEILTEQMTNTNPSLILQKIFLHHVSEMGCFKEIGNISFERFEDIAPYTITNEIELYKKRIKHLCIKQNNK